MGRPGVDCRSVHYIMLPPTRVNDFAGRIANIPKTVVIDCAIRAVGNDSMTSWVVLRHSEYGHLGLGVSSWAGGFFVLNPAINRGQNNIA